MLLENSNPIFENLLNVYYRLVLTMTEDLTRYGFQSVIQVSWRGNEAWRYKPTSRKGGYELILWDKRYSSIKSIKQPQLPSLDFFNYTFILRYYPHPDEEIFEDFSINEQLVRLSECFGEEEIFPKDSCSNNIDETLFTTGTLNLSINELEGIVRLSLLSQDRFTSILEEPVIINNNILRNQGEIDRNVPGWSLSWEFYRNLLNIYISKLGKPWLVVAYAEPGTLWKCSKTGCNTETTSSTLLKNIETIFAASRNPQTISLLEEALEETIKEKLKTTVKSLDTIELPYIRILVKNDEISQKDDPLFQEELNYLYNMY